MEECASGLSTVSANLAQRGRHANRRLYPHTPFHRGLGTDPPTGTTLVTQAGTPLVILMDTLLATPMYTVWYPSGQYLSKCLLMVMALAPLHLTTWAR